MEGTSATRAQHFEILSHILVVATTSLRQSNKLSFERRSTALFDKSAIETLGDVADSVIEDKLSLSTTRLREYC